jgi:hypothetical protein
MSETQTVTQQDYDEPRRDPGVLTDQQVRGYIAASNIPGVGIDLYWLVRTVYQAGRNSAPAAQSEPTATGPELSWEVRCVLLTYAPKVCGKDLEAIHKVITRSFEYGYHQGRAAAANIEVPELTEQQREHYQWTYMSSGLSTKDLALQVYRDAVTETLRRVREGV